MGKTFKELIHSDITETFLNNEEFSDIHIIDGKPMTAMEDAEEIIEREKKMKSNMDGLFVSTKLIYVNAEEFGALPAVGRALMYDGKQYRILDAEDNAGVYSIFMERNRGV